MIVVLDTNVVISALLSPHGAPAEIIRRWQSGDFDVAISPPLLVELRRALGYGRVSRYLRQTQGEVTAFVRRLELVATVVEPRTTLDAVDDDPDDNRVLECALAAGATVVVTGDAHLLRMSEYGSIAIVNPAGFLALFQPGG